MTSLASHLRELEESLWRNDPSHRSAILDDEFKEFCRFGAIYDKQHLLTPTETSPTVEFPFDAFEVESLTDEVALVTYENVVNGERARRSSVWVNGEDGWQLRFMQATTLEE